MLIQILGLCLAGYILFSDKREGGTYEANMQAALRAGAKLKAEQDLTRLRDAERRARVAQAEQARKLQQRVTGAKVDPFTFAFK